MNPTFCSHSALAAGDGRVPLLAHPDPVGAAPRHREAPLPPPPPHRIPLSPAGHGRGRACAAVLLPIRRHENGRALAVLGLAAAPGARGRSPTRAARLNSRPERPAPTAGSRAAAAGVGRPPAASGESGGRPPRSWRPTPLLCRCCGEPVGAWWLASVLTLTLRAPRKERRRPRRPR